MKHCSKCDTYKEKSDFTKSSQGKDGLNSWCKVCTRRNNQMGYNANRKLRKSQTSAYQRTDVGKKVASNAYHKWRDSHPKEYICHMIVKTATKYGVIKVGVCETCGSKNVQAHHEDYDRPFHVRWFCSQHHKDTHHLNSL